MRIRTEETRRVIAQAALSTICDSGYRVAPLEAKDAEVGLTRRAALPYVSSMTDLLSAFLRPDRRALVDMVLITKAGYLPTGIQRRRLPTGFPALPTCGGGG
jgi:hypothetical protein